MRPEGWVTPWATENHMNEALTIFWNLEHIPSCLGSWLAFPWTLETSFSTNFFFPRYHHWQNYLLCWSSPPLGAVENMALGIDPKHAHLLGPGWSTVTGMFKEVPRWASCAAGLHLIPLNLNHHIPFHNLITFPIYLCLNVSALNEKSLLFLQLWFFLCSSSQEVLIFKI